MSLLPQCRYIMTVRYASAHVTIFATLTFLLTLLAGCASPVADKQNDPVNSKTLPDTAGASLIECNSKLIRDTIIQWDKSTNKNYTPIDSSIYRKLMASNIFRPRSESDLFNIYYYGFLDTVNKIYFPAVFYKFSATDCGNYELILVNFDKNGSVIDVLPIALSMNPAECNINTIAFFRKNGIYIRHTEDCDNGIDTPTHDTTIERWAITPNGTFLKTTKGEKKSH